MEDAEAQMRRALGLFGEGARNRPDADRQEPAARSGGFAQAGFPQGGVHRRRFVQDGEIPVTVVRRDAPDAMAQGPTSSRLQRTEAALTAETAARDRAERGLQETQAALQALQTKIGHNELAKNEAVAAYKRVQEEIVTLREELAGSADRLVSAEERADEAQHEVRALRAELSEERRARRQIERLPRERAEEPAFAPAFAPVFAGHAEIEPERPRRGRPPNIRPEPEPASGPEPEPVKWWLTPPKGAAKRR